MWQSILLFIVLIAVAYQDFRYRAIGWYLFILLPLVILAQNINNIQTVLFHFLINSGFLLLNAFVLLMFFSFKHRKFVNPLNSYIGTGDLLFFISVALLFSPLNYIVFFTVSLFVTLITYFFIFNVFHKHGREIPLAGFVSIILLCLVTYKTYFHISLQDDSWILQRIVYNGIY